MNVINTLRLTLLILIPYMSWGQFNIQTGYDFGIVRFPDEPFIQQPSYIRNINYNFLHRINFISEYQFRGRWLISIDLGYDTYRTKADYITSKKDLNYCITSDLKYDATVNTLRPSLSLGYLIKLSKKSSLVFKGNYGLFIVQNRRIFKSERTITHSDCYNQSVFYRESYMFDLVDFGRPRGPRKFGLNRLMISSEYRQQIMKFDLNIFLGFGLMNKEFIPNNSSSSRKNLIFISGIRLGYFLPSISRNNEK